MKQNAEESAMVQLKKEIEQEKFSRLYFFYGQEVFLRDHYFQLLKSKILPSGTETFNLHELDGKEMTLLALEQALDSFPMMAERTFVVVTDWEIFKEKEENRTALMDMILEIPDHCTLLFFYDIIQFKLDTRSKLGKCIQEHGVLVDFVPQSQDNLIKWVQSSFHNMGKECPSSVALELIFYCGDLMTKLSSEMEKIAAYANEKEIKKEDIYAVATPHLDAVVFQMTDYMGDKNFDGALGVLWELYQMQEHPLMIMKVVTRLIRQIYGARLALDQRKNSDYVAKLWGLKPYPAKKITESARRFSVEWCRNACILCASVDLGMKSGSGNEEELLTGLILELANGGEVDEKVRI